MKSNTPAVHGQEVEETPADSDDDDTPLPASFTPPKDVVSLTSTSTSSSSIDWTQVLAADQVRAQLYREEPNLPRLPIPSATLIGTTAAFFLKELLERAVRGHSDGRNPDPDADQLIQCSDIQRVVQDTPAFDFVQNSWEDLGVDQWIQNERQRPPNEYRPRPKRTRNDTATSRTAKKVMESVRGQPAAQHSEEVVTGAGANTPAGTIMVNEDDYD